MEAVALSPAIQLLDVVWRHNQSGRVSSWQRLNETMGSALALAIRAGLAFDPEDFKLFIPRYRFGYWGGADSGGFGEHFYSLAVRNSNMKACQAFEHWKQRKPFIFHDVNFDSFGAGGFKTSRLAVGAWFTWQGQNARVTSFSDDGQYLVACSYKPKEGDYYSTAKIDKRYKITRHDLLAQRKAGAEAAQECGGPQ